MGQPSRMAATGYPHHIVQQGNRRQQTSFRFTPTSSSATLRNAGVGAPREKVSAKEEGWWPHLSMVDPELNGRAHPMGVK